MTSGAPPLAHLRAGGVSVVVDLSGGIPAALHWGADLGELSAADLKVLAKGGVSAAVINGVDDPVRLAVLPEHHTGWVGRPGITGSRRGVDWSPMFQRLEVRLDGAVIEGRITEPISTGPGLLEIHSSDETAGLDLAVRIELTAAGVLRCQAELTNTLAGAYQLDDLVLSLPVPTVARELLDFSGYWARERVPQRRTFTVGQHVREGRRGRTGADAALVLHAGTPGFGFADGEVWGVHVGWSGNHTHYAERLPTGEQLIGGGELLFPGEIVLGLGESYTTPWLYGSYGVGLDAVARRFHRHLRNRPQHPRTPRPVTLNVWEAVYFDHSLPPLLDLAEKAASVGVERFVLDDGWFSSRRDEFSGLGDWTVSREVWPDGLHPLVDRVRALGMQFGLWFEPEMISPDSDVARLHPEWILATGNRQPALARHQQVIDLGNPACYAYIRDAILALLAEYEISYIKWDHNRDLIDAGHPPRGRPSAHRQTVAVYRLMDEIRAAHPGLEIESCSSGGSRVDLGVLERTDRIWVSDCIDPHERQSMLRWTGQLIPPELMGSHIASATSHTTGRTHDLDFRAATAIFGHLGIEWNLGDAAPEELTELAAWISLHKAARNLLHAGDLVRMDFPDDALVAAGVLAADRSRAIYSFARTSVAQTSLLGRLRFPGLDPNHRYQVTPIAIGHPPSGLRAPVWWGEPQVDANTSVMTWVGVELPGPALTSCGLMDTPVHPDHAVIYLLDQAGRT